MGFPPVWKKIRFPKRFYNASRQGECNKDNIKCNTWPWYSHFVLQAWKYARKKLAPDFRHLKDHPTARHVEGSPSHWPQTRKNKLPQTSLLQRPQYQWASFHSVIIKWHHPRLRQTNYHLPPATYPSSDPMQTSEKRLSIREHSISTTGKNTRL